MTIDALDPSTLPGRGRVLVAFSGGPDSVCMLHQLARVVELTRPLSCVHIDHGLDGASRERAGQAARIAEALGVDCRIVRVRVGSGRGLEAEARQARYAALAAVMEPDDALLTAHHADDQIETVLLRLLRGAGPEGLAGIRPVQQFGPGWLARPLLDWESSDISAWLEAYRLPSIDDPANDCPDFDRNYLRHTIIPALLERWPGMKAALQRSARLCRGASDLMAGHIRADLDTASDREGRLNLGRLNEHSEYYRGESIRAWCIRNRVEPPPGRRLDAFVSQLSSASADRCPELRWQNAVLRSWKGDLWLETEAVAPNDWALHWTGDNPLQLPAGLGRFLLKGSAAPPLEMKVRSGRPGDSLRPANDAHRRDCKRLLADAGVPPWQRDLWPRLCLDGKLAALGDRWCTLRFERLLKDRNQSLVWEPGAVRMTIGLESTP